MQFSEVRLGHRLEFVDTVGQPHLLPNREYMKIGDTTAQLLTPRTAGARTREGNPVTVRPDALVRLP